MLRFAAGFREDGLEMEEFSPGGGFAIAYTRDQEPPSVADYAGAIVGTMESTCEELGLSDRSCWWSRDEASSGRRGSRYTESGQSRIFRGCGSM